MTNKIRFSNKAISAAGGLIFFQHLIEKTQLSAHLESALPTTKIKTRTSSFEKFKAMILGLIQGAECLDDMDRCQVDPVFQQLSPYHLTPTTYGNFLRRFDRPMISQLSQALMSHSFELHKKLNPEGPIIFDIDSSSHLQHGMKMEGLSINYVGDRCLDSLEVFDQFGQAYHLNVRDGATFSAQNAPFVIEQLGSVVRIACRRSERIVRADSGFSNKQVFEACEHAGFDFVIAMRENLYAPLFRRRIEWRKAKNQVFIDEGVEFGEGVYHSKLCGKLYRVVLMRKPIAGPRPLFEDAKWEYYGWIKHLGL